MKLDEIKRAIRKIPQNVIWTFISVLLAVVTVRIVLKQNKDMSINELLLVIKASDPRYMIIALVFSLLYVVFEGMALNSILKHGGYKNASLNWLLYSTSDVYFSAITPSATGGQPASAFFMMRDGIPGGIATATLVLNLVMYTLSIIVLGFISMIICPEAIITFGTASKVLITAGFVILTLLSLVFVVLLKRESVIFIPMEKLIMFLHRKNIIRESQRRILKLEQIRNDYKRCSGLISSSRKILLYSFFWNFIQRATQICVPMLVFRATGGKTSKMVVVFAKQCLITIGYNFVPIPGGMGISDYLMFDGFSVMMGEETALNVALISRGITFYMCVLISGIITLAGHLLTGKNRHRKA
ncbi:MAG: flippase-like domain-containing protein [Lachnospiraceae bacterium]|nr:flippase-like domain-containing protein [Lachnospiraceae bacterium]